MAEWSEHRDAHARVKSFSQHSKDEKHHQIPQFSEYRGKKGEGTSVWMEKERELTERYPGNLIPKNKSQKY